MKNRAENERLLTEIRSERAAERKQAAAVARHHAREARIVAHEGRAAIIRTRRDVSVTFPEALAGLDANGMATAELLRLQIFDQMSRATAAQLYSAQCGPAMIGHKTEEMYNVIFGRWRTVVSAS